MPNPSCLGIKLSWKHLKEVSEGWNVVQQLFQDVCAEKVSFLAPIHDFILI